MLSLIFHRPALLAIAPLALVAIVLIGQGPRMSSAADAPRETRADIVVADFEGKDYGEWKATGDAFGSAPAQGTLPDQMPVSGFQGHGLANSFLHGDAATGTLTSPEFRIERKFLNFLIGGGNHPGETCVNLLVDNKVVRATSGPDDERLDWATWDLSDLANKTARIEIVDKATGGWGHINIDQIVQSDRRKAEAPEVAVLYRESLRPQFHFTAERNWLNDPNGLVFYGGEYHLFFQHNPSGIDWGNMTWGHAVSKDLLHWRQLGHALEPDSLGTMFSGSAVVDWRDTAGFGKQLDSRPSPSLVKDGAKPAPLVAIYTAAGGTSAESKGKPFTQCIASSNDEGRTWRKYEKNPVLPHIVGQNRDPKVFWHAPTKKWVMSLFLDGEQYALFGSSDLKEWTKLSDLPVFGAGECPDMFELKTPDGSGATKWVFWGGNGNYLIGSFDGIKFAKEGGPYRFEYGANYYAAQTYSDIPSVDGRRIQIAWMSGGKYPGMPFNQQMSFPSTLALAKTADGLRVCRQPVQEIESLRGEHRDWHGALKGSDNPLAEISGDTLDIRAEIEVGAAKELKFGLRGADLSYDTAKQELRLLGKTAPLPLTGGKLSLTILLDRGSIEVFASGGIVTMASCFQPEKGATRPLALRGDGATAKSLNVWQLKSCWP